MRFSRGPVSSAVMPRGTTSIGGMSSRSSPPSEASSLSLRPCGKSLVSYEPTAPLNALTERSRWRRTSSKMVGKLQSAFVEHFSDGGNPLGVFFLTHRLPAHRERSQQADQRERAGHQDAFVERVFDERGIVAAGRTEKGFARNEHDDVVRRTFGGLISAPRQGVDVIA